MPDTPLTSNFGCLSTPTRILRTPTNRRKFLNHVMGMYEDWGARLLDSANSGTLEQDLAWVSVQGLCRSCVKTPSRSLRRSGLHKSDRRCHA